MGLDDAVLTETLVRAGHVEVPQTGSGETVGRCVRGDGVVDREFRRTVRVGGTCGVVLGDGSLLRARRRWPRWREHQLGVPEDRIASRRARDVTTFPLQYLSGDTTDSPTNDCAAKCRTASKSPPVNTSAATSLMSPSTKVTPAGTASRLPVDRLSTTTTSWPRSSSTAAHTLPTYPAPPVTRSFTVRSPHTRQRPSVGRDQTFFT